MCTLILARDVLGPATMLLAANRDERAARPTIPPGLLQAQPRVVGGRDQVAGGTWLALREDRAAVALLNRRDPDAHDPPANHRSRGLLTLDVAASPAEPTPARRAANAAAQDSLARAALERALESIARERYAPFSLVYASPTSCWMVALEGGEPRVSPIAPGWHVLTHQELDDPHEPRAAHWLARLKHERPPSREAAETLLMSVLRSHGEDGAPPVCLHQGVMVTVSSSLVWMDANGARYLHAEGRPCEHPYEDRTPLLSGAAQSGGRR